MPIAVAEEEGSESEEDELKPRGTISLNRRNEFFKMPIILDRTLYRIHADVIALRVKNTHESLNPEVFLINI